MKNFYVLAWFLLVASVLASVFTGSFNPVALLVFSLFALVLFKARALWSVIVQTRDSKTE